MIGCRSTAIVKPVEGNPGSSMQSAGKRKERTMAKLKFVQGIIKIEGRLTGVNVRELSDENLERWKRGSRSERVHPVTQEQRRRHRQAADYTLRVMADPDLRAVYI
jgi:hypothetical protein